MMKYYSVFVSLLSLGSVVLGAEEIGTVVCQNPPVCASSFAATNNSYTMSPGEKLLSFSNSIFEGFVTVNGVIKQQKQSQYVMMQVPINPTSENWICPKSSQEGSSGVFNCQCSGCQCALVHSDPIPQLPSDVITKINTLLQQTETQQGQTIYIYYTLTPDVANNQYTVAVTVSASGNGKGTLVYSSPDAQVLTRTFHSTGHVSAENIGRALTYPSQQQMEKPPFTIPAMPCSLPISFTTNQQNAGLQQGVICFSSSSIAKGQQEMFYSASFTIKPAPFVAPVKSIANAQAIIQPLLTMAFTSTVDQVNAIVTKLTSASYVSINDWINYICPALTKLSVSSALGQAIVKNMNVEGASYPCSMSQQKHKKAVKKTDREKVSKSKNSKK